MTVTTEPIDTRPSTADRRSRRPDPIGCRSAIWIHQQAQPVLEAYASYFAPEVRGFDNLPADGPLLARRQPLRRGHAARPAHPLHPLVAGAGHRRPDLRAVPLVLHQPARHRQVRAQGRRHRGGPEAAERVLRGGGNLVVFPGGDHEAFRPWSERNQIDFAGPHRLHQARPAHRRARSSPSCRAARTRRRSCSPAARSSLKFMPHLRLMRVKVSPIVLGPPFGHLARHADAAAARQGHRAAVQAHRPGAARLRS